MSTGNRNYLVNSPDGRCEISATIRCTNAISAKTNYVVGVLSPEVRPSANVIMSCYSYHNTVGGAYIRASSGEIVIWLVDALPANDEVAIMGSWYNNI